MYNKSIVVGLIVVLLVAIGAYFYPQYGLGVVGPGAGSFNGTRGFASLDVALANGSSTSILNTDSFDRLISEAFVGCQGLSTSLNASGAGVASLLVQVATTTVANLGLQGNANYIGNLTVGTSTSNGTAYVSTTTNPFPNEQSRVWPSGTYLTFNFNATSSAALCTEGVSYIR